MSEIREGYKVTLLDEILSPGPKLDVLVTSITDVEGSPSTDPAAAMDAWEWLEENHPWKGRLMLGRDFDKGNPAVIQWTDAAYDWESYVIASGKTYPHAISLAVVEAGKALRVIEEVK